MSLTTVLAQSTVTDLDAAERWYTTLFEREPDARPMPGLIEWHLESGSGLQVYAEPDRAGHSSTVLTETDLDGAARRLLDAGLTEGSVEDLTASRALMLVDPDGNRVVLVGP